MIDFDGGLKPEVGSVASLFVSRWDAAVAGKVPRRTRRARSKKNLTAKVYPERSRSNAKDTRKRRGGFTTKVAKGSDIFDYKPVCLPDRLHAVSPCLAR